MRAFTRARLSETWLPTGGIAATENENGHALLLRAGFLRQSHAGVFHMLPFGMRVQDKLESLIHRHMRSVKASKVSLSSLSSQELWTKTGRLQGYGQELFKLRDRKEAPYLLAPTHEEEITSLVGRAVSSHKQLPLRLYQIGRKYRDELRPRHGLLRSREFLMKDLYTFDATTDDALETYEEVRAAYSRLFDELGVPYLVAEASSGDIGGDLSHEYHLAVSTGEDNVMSCDSCDYVANEELAVSKPPETNICEAPQVWRGISKDRTTLVNVWYPDENGASAKDINTHLIKSLVPDLDTGIENPVLKWHARNNEALLSTQPTLVNIIDGRLQNHNLFTHSNIADLLPPDSDLDHGRVSVKFVRERMTEGQPDGALLNVLRIRDGDDCARCHDGKLIVQKAVELGHTFHLGTRYSEPLEARATLRDGSSVPLQMGCHGIGVSRIIGAVADYLSDDKGLNWPRSIAPFEVVVIAGRGVSDTDVETVYDRLRAQTCLADDAPTIRTEGFDAVIDDRHQSMPYKMIDAELVGYPVVIIIGRGWVQKRCEVQCKRLGSKEEVLLDELPVYVQTLFDRLATI
jgi:prolyl-tRNA synthetase